MKLQVVDSIDSTTSELLRRPLEEISPGTALLALTQSGGKGRANRVFESPRGGMYLSVSLVVRQPQGLALLGAKALLDLLEEFGMRGRLRWPNDVMLKGRKVAGVLPVARFQGQVLERAILGVGLNVNSPKEGFPESLREHVTTLADQCPTTLNWDIREVAQRYLQHLQDELSRLESQGLKSLCKSCELYLEGLADGRSPVLVGPGSALRELPLIVGLTELGALRLEDGTILDALGPEQRLRFADELSNLN